MEWWQSSHPPYRLTLFPSSASHLLALLKTLEPMYLPHWLEATLYVAINQILKKGWFYKRRHYVSLAFGCPEEPAWITQGTGEGVDSSVLACFKDFRFVLGRIIRKYTRYIFHRTQTTLTKPSSGNWTELLFEKHGSSLSSKLLRSISFIEIFQNTSVIKPMEHSANQSLTFAELVLSLAWLCGFMEGGPRLYYLLPLRHPWLKSPYYTPLL